MPNVNDDRPIESSARKPPSRSKLYVGDGQQLPTRKKSVDPRFDPLHGPLNNTEFKQRYKFLEEMEEDEQKNRLRRIKILNTALKRIRMEHALAAKKIFHLANKKERQAAAAAGEQRDEGYDLAELEEIVGGLSDDENDAWGDDADAMHQLEELRHLPEHMVRHELEGLKRQSTIFKSKTSNSRALSQKSSVKKDLLKAEIQAVRAGKKSKVFVPKRTELKKRVLEKTYESLQARGGQQMVSTFLERKAKRRR